MRLFKQILLVTGVSLALSGGQVAAKPAAKGAKDPVVGQWVIKQGGQPVVLNFKPNGTVSFDTSAIEKQMRAAAGNDPARKQQVTQAAQQMRATKLTWKKTGKVYLVSGGPSGASSSNQYVKIQGKQLVPCSKDGTPVKGSPTATRK